MKKKNPTTTKKYNKSKLKNNKNKTKQNVESNNEMKGEKSK